MNELITAGIDVGSNAVKVVLIASVPGSGRARVGARIIGRALERTRRRDQRQLVELAWQRAVAEANRHDDDVAYVATTGEGESVERRTGHFYGMTAHARGALFLDGAARGALDVGSLHARAIRFDAEARVLDQRMTSQCASGTGQFLENIARYLGVTLDEVGALSRRGDKPEKVSGICAVLAETDVINMVSRGISTANILKGIHESMAAGLAKLLRNAKCEGVVLVTGGLCADEGLLDCLGAATSVTIRPHPDGIYAGAIGAALWGAYRLERLRDLKARDQLSP